MATGAEAGLVPKIERGILPKKSLKRDSCDSFVASIKACQDYMSQGSEALGCETLYPSSDTGTCSTGTCSTGTCSLLETSSKEESSKGDAEIKIKIKIQGKRSMRAADRILELQKKKKELACKLQVDPVYQEAPNPNPTPNPNPNSSPSSTSNPDPSPNPNRKPTPSSLTPAL